MFIKILDECSVEILANANLIRRVSPRFSGEGSIVEFNTGQIISLTSLEEIEQKLLAVHRIIDAIKKRGSRTSYASMITGETIEHYTIRGRDLDLIEREEE